MRRYITLVASVIATLGLTAPAQAAPNLCGPAYNERAKVVKKHGKRAPGRNICRYGVITKKHTHGTNWHVHTRDATTKEKRRYLRQLRKLNRPPTYSTLVRTAAPPRQAPAQTLSPSVAAGGTLSAIAQCESGGNPRAVSPGGTYRGKYQFDYGTWRSVGGSGDPAAAPEAEQDKRAAILYSQRGAQPWPVCGR